MELKEAIDNINLLITNLENLSVKEIEPENYILLNSLKIVLEELNNRIPIKDIEDIYNELKKVYEDELNRLGMTMKGSALDVLEYILNKYKE